MMQNSNVDDAADGGEMECPVERRSNESNYQPRVGQAGKFRKIKADTLRWVRYRKLANWINNEFNEIFKEAGDQSLCGQFFYPGCPAVAVLLPLKMEAIILPFARSLTAPPIIGSVITTNLNLINPTVLYFPIKSILSIEHQGRPMQFK